jgi:peptidoglycan hydrolase CwlO-like protein
MLLLYGVCLFAFHIGSELMWKYTMYKRDITITQLQTALTAQQSVIPSLQENITSLQRALAEEKDYAAAWKKAAKETKEQLDILRAKKDEATLPGVN